METLNAWLVTMDPQSVPARVLAAVTGWIEAVLGIGRVAFAQTCPDSNCSICTTPLSECQTVCCSGCYHTVCHCNIGSCVTGGAGSDCSLA